MSLTPRHCWRSGCFLRSRGPPGCCTEQWSLWGQKPWQQWRGPRSGCVRFLCALFPACKGAKAQIRGAQACGWDVAGSMVRAAAARHVGHLRLTPPQTRPPKLARVLQTSAASPSPSWLVNIPFLGLALRRFWRWCTRKERAQKYGQSN